MGYKQNGASHRGGMSLGEGRKYGPKYPKDPRWAVKSAQANVSIRREDHAFLREEAYKRRIHLTQLMAEIVECYKMYKLGMFKEINISTA